MTDRCAAVTGATGFLGRSIVDALSAAGWRVRILARQAPDAARFGGRPIDTVVGDLANRQALGALVEGADVVVHAAGLIKASSLDAFRAVNVAGTANLVDAINDSGSGKHLVLVSSMAAREPQLSDYAATKRESENVVSASLRPAHSWTIARPCAVYGPSDKETFAIFRAASHRILPLPGGKDGRLALIHATDAAAAIAGLCGSDSAGDIFELTDQRVEGYGWPEIIGVLKMALGHTVIPLPLPSAIVRTAAVLNGLAARIGGRAPIFSPGKAREILHPDWGSSPERLPPAGIWQPRIALADGFRETVSWYRAQNWLPAHRPSAA